MGATLAALLALSLPAPALAAECEGDECQGPPSAPAEVIPATSVVEGPENPPVRFPKARHPKKPQHKKPAPHKHRQPSSHHRGPQ